MSRSPRFNGLDRAIAGLWYWKLRRTIAQRNINEAPEQADRIEDTYQEWKDYEFACRFGRPTDREIASAVLKAEKNGGDVNALGLLITNRDASVRNGQLQYRNSNWLKVLSYLAFAICLVGSIMFATLLALAPMPLPLKLLAYFVTFAILIGGAYVFELYTSRPLAAVKKLQTALEQPTQANIVSLHSHPAFKVASSDGRPE